MKVYTDEYLEELFDEIDTEWVWANPISALNLIKHLICQCKNCAGGTAMLGDDMFYEQEQKHINEWNKEMESLHDVK